MAIQKIVDDMRTTTALDAAKLSGNIDATQLSGNVPTGSITAASVTQHSPPPDLTSVHQAIASLGLHTAVSDNKASYNLPNAFIDQFEDDTGIATETTTDRNASEYVSSVSESFGTPAYVTGNRASSITLTSNVVVQGSTGGAGVQNLINGNTNSFYFASQNVAGLHFTFQWTVKQKITEARWYNDEADDSQGQGYWKWQGSNDGTAWTDIGSSFQLINTGMVGGAGGYQELTTLSGNTTGYFYYKMLGVSGTCGTYSNHQELDFKQVAASTISNATGTLVSTVQTAPVATTTLSGVILYTDEAGTNTLGTGGTHNLGIWLTANLQGTTPNWTGTNWYDVGDTGSGGGGYGTPQTFSGTTKQVKLGKTTVTSGTAVAMKAVWANQVAATPGAQTKISTAGITSIGNSTFRGGIAAAFDGNTTQGHLACACTTNLPLVTCGKDWGVGVTKTVTGIKIWPNDGNSAATIGWSTNYTGAVSMILEGSTDNFSSSTVNLGAIFTGISADTHTPVYVLSGLVTSTAYRYHRVKMTRDSTNDLEGCIAELEFYETSTPVDGKVAQLNGWAVNY